MQESNTIERDDASRQLDERLLELTALFEISRSLTSSLSLQSILENLLRIPMGHMLIGKGLILLKDSESEEYTIEGIKGLSRNFLGKSIRIDDPPSYTVFMDDLNDEYDWIDSLKEFDLELILPLNSSQGMIGLLGFSKKISGKPFTEGEVEFLNSLSNIASSAVTNGLMVEEIQSVNRRLDRKIQQLNTIFDISRELNTTLDREKIASLLSFAIMGELLVNRCAIFTRQNDTMELLLTKGFKVDLSGDGELLAISEPVELEDSPAYQKYHDAGLALLVPMRIHDEIRGVIGIGPKISSGHFDEADFEFLKTLGNQAVTSLENARLFEETLEKQRMEEELNLARSIQRQLLPSELPKIDGYQVSAINIPSKEVGGDYYDIIPISENEYGVCIADVSGKGAGAALLMANLQAGLHALKPKTGNMADMIGRINNLIYQNTDLDKFITFFYGVLNQTENTFTYCNAGHNPPYLLETSGGTKELMTGGLVLGMMPDMIYEVETITLKSTESMLLFTDGITETVNENDEEYAEERLQDLLKENKETNPDTLVNLILERLQIFQQSTPQIDDMTMIAIKKL